MKELIDLLVQHGSQCGTLTAGGSGLMFSPSGLAVFREPDDKKKKKKTCFIILIWSLCAESSAQRWKLSGARSGTAAERGGDV